MIAKRKDTKEGLLAKAAIKFSLKVLRHFVEHFHRSQRTITVADKLQLHKAGIDNGQVNSSLFKMLKANDDLVTLALNSIKHLNEVGFDIDTKDITLLKNVIYLLTKSTEFNNDVIESSFSLLLNIFANEIPKMSTVEHDILFYSLKENLYVADSVKTPLMFLKLLVDKPFVKPEIYDCMPKVFEIFFESHSDFFKSTAQGVILQFIQSYPIDEQLLLKYANDLTKNIDSPNNQTRMMVADFLAKMFEIHGLKIFQGYVS
jgi:hypothetical protein